MGRTGSRCHPERSGGSAFAIGIVAAILTASSLAAQATPFVPPNDRVYADIDKLTGAGLIDTIVVGVRPYSRREVVRLLNEARRNVGRLPSARNWAEDLISIDLERYAAHDARPIDMASLELAYLDSPYRGVTPDPNGSIDAAINPLAAHRGGRPLADGSTATLETMHSVTLGSHVALSLSPRLSARAWRGGGSTQTVRLQSASANLLFGNLSIDVGRDYALFGQSPSGGVLLSDNALPIDGIRLSTDRPAPLPWLFRFLGPMSGTLFLADLGTAHQTHDHAKVVGYHVVAHPHPRFEIGVEVLDETGGEGAPPASFGERVADAIPLVDVFRPNKEFLFSNKFAGIDVRFRAPALAGLELYVEAAADDFDARRLRSTLLEDTGYLAGISFACITECGRVGLRAEFHQTGIRYYTHTDFASGIQQNGIMLGDPLGPRGLGGYLTIDSDVGKAGTFAVSGAYEVRSGNRYASTASGAGDAGFRFVQVEHRPGEHRGRMLATWTSSRRSRMTLSGTLGVEQVANYAFVDGNDRTNVLAQIRYEFRP